MPRRPRPVPELGAAPFRGTAAVAAGLLTRHELAGPGWSRLHRDVYVAAGAPVTHAVRVQASVALVPGAVVTGSSAARLYGVDLGPGESEPVELTVPGGSGGWSTTGVRVRRRDLARHSVVVLDGLQVTSAVVTAVDLAVAWPHPQAVAVLDQFVAARLATLEEVRAEAALRTGPGSARGRRAAAVADGLAASPPETVLRMLLASSGLPVPVAQYEVRDRRGRFVARVDFGWPGLRFAVEYDGAGHVDRLAHDRRRLNALQDAGWRVFFVTAAEMHDPQRLLLTIAAAMADCLR
ncbi:endonuclease domain-containing protein [Modestobacter sp. Leaf380]|uniref:endonuclease domain-containing protein n=1 Tax=Modestobacter sp. Leaf380 TaxID=1736356 RepID=UPI0006F5DB25|nr:DUF559 domain-containing protein [Modestobacter sp. Leaf380]KQS66437.1 hypothetical protein ASG41_12795 [Modestobacter sp. Leaf380]